MQKDYFLYQNEYNEGLESIRDIYSKINDSDSKEIYLNRLLYSLTLETKYIHNIVIHRPIGQEFQKKLNEIGDNSILIYGAGKRGKQLVDVFPDVKWSGFVDKYQIGKYHGLDIKGFNRYPEIYKSFIIVSNQTGFREIESELISKGIDKKKVILLEEWNKLASENQYIEKRCIKLEDANKFVDAGCFDGLDSCKFIQKIKKDDYKIWAFEPDNKQYGMCKKNLASYPNVTVFNMGLSEKRHKGYMILKNNSGSFINNIHNEGIEVSLISLDELLLNEQIDYIKMDIEGEEERAIIGARKIIEKYRPRMAVSIYHKKNDILRIPKLLLDFNSDYKFSFGHYSLGNVDSVLYAF